MISVVFAIAPIFVLIVLGNWLRRNGIPSIEFWNQNDKLVYWVLFPALLFNTTSHLTLPGDIAGSFAIILICAFLGPVVYSLITYRLFGMTPEVGSSLLQGSARHNTFIALAIAENLFGLEGLSIAALVTAVLIPLTNVGIVGLMVGMLPHDKNIVRAIFGDLLRNPLLLAVGIGLFFNWLGLQNIPVLHDAAGLLGAAALPVVLLCIGANLRVQEMQAGVLPVALSILGKFIVFPLTMFIAIQVMGLQGLPALILMVFSCVPTAASSFTLARQMGGDAPLAAAMVTIQTALSFITLPIAIALLANYFSVSLG